MIPSNYIWTYDDGALSGRYQAICRHTNEYLEMCECKNCKASTLASSVFTMSAAMSMMHHYRPMAWMDSHLEYGMYYNSPTMWPLGHMAYGMDYMGGYLH